MDIEFTTLGARGQAVIPKTLRDKMTAPTGTTFSVMLIDKDTLVMKRVNKARMWQEFQSFRNSIKKKLTEGEIVAEIKRMRKSKGNL